MPDDYYVSQYSGEEIDERLTAAHNAVRYDAAQTLTDEQKQQARENIGAAPAGYGLGVALSNENAITDCNDATACGWYTSRGATNAPTWSTYGVLLVSARDGANLKTQVFFSSDSSNKTIISVRSGGFTWGAWECVNPPMVVGVEYRTTERYLGKPVYVKVVDCGNLPASGLKNIAHGIANCKPIHVYGEMSNGNTLPYATGTNFYISADGNYIQIYVTDDLSGQTAKATIKYTKTTD